MVRVVATSAGFFFTLDLDRVLGRDQYAALLFIDGEQLDAIADPRSRPHWIDETYPIDAVIERRGTEVLDPSLR